MAFYIEHRGPSGQKFRGFIERSAEDVDDVLTMNVFWNPRACAWTRRAVPIVLPEVSRGHYSYHFRHALPGRSYRVLVYSATDTKVIDRRVLADGRPVAAARKRLMNLSFRNGVLHDGNRSVDPAVFLETLSSNGVTKYLAVKWANGVTSCNCPGWTQNAKNKGKGIEARSCKHTLEVARLEESRFLPGTNLVAPSVDKAAATAALYRTGRNIEID